ncbi:hypothetical protein CFBP6624_12790 [Agrobacterium tumefaciens]|uniref:Uncharacterized protein n=1 Tax=Agrobacterium tumefaciens TaxID=358 RepID=A0AAE6ELE1_AGRTU|nr:hypothetical protein CFBP6624_12790 [Agrobacterium tumefaciens]
MGRKFNVLSANRLHLLAVSRCHHGHGHAHHTWQCLPAKAIGLDCKLMQDAFFLQFYMQIQLVNGEKRIRRKRNREGQRTVCERIEYESLTQRDSAFVLRNIWLAKEQLIPDYESG